MWAISEAGEIRLSVFILYCNESRHFLCRIEHTLVIFCMCDPRIGRIGRVGGIGCISRVGLIGRIGRVGLSLYMYIDVHSTKQCKFMRSVDIEKRCWVGKFLSGDSRIKSAAA